MVAVDGGELSPIVTGLSTAASSTAARRCTSCGARSEWTAALTRWCDSQPDLVAFTGTCLVHRAELMQLHGAWADALEEARRARERSSRARARRPPAQALYRQGEIHRLRGDLAAAEAAYREASRRAASRSRAWPCCGWRRAGRRRGRRDRPGRRRDRASRLQRGSLLPACVEIMLAAGDASAARATPAASSRRSPARDDAGMLARDGRRTRAAAVELADGDARGRARRAAQRLAAVAGARRAVRGRAHPGAGRAACRALGDDDAAAMELEAARAVFAQLGRGPDLARVDSLAAARGAGARAA